MGPVDSVTAGRTKRIFRAKRKLNVPNLVSHVTQRAAGREPLFLEDGDYLTMIALIKDTAEQYALAVYAFCLMPNHVHLLFSPQEANLYEAMRYLFSRYAMRFNSKYERKGHLFCGPYRQAVCLHDSYLLAASLYIHQNPVKAGLTKDSMAYRWSSCRLYGDETLGPSFVDAQFILGLLSTDDKSAKKRYRELLRHGEALEIGDVLEEEGVIESFLERLISVVPSLLDSVRTKGRIAGLSGIDFLDSKQLDSLVDAVRSGRFRDKAQTRRAKRYLIDQLVARGYQRREIAQRLGVSRKTVYNLIKSST